MTVTANPDDIGDYLLSARSFEEYREFFALATGDLRGSILDCPGGASEFTARACALGAAAIAVDPVYAEPPDDVARRALTELDRAEVHTAAGRDRYLWDRFGDLAGHRQVRAASAERFAEDLRRHPARYRAGSLPRLPFPERTFDLVLSSHLLFTYAPRLSLAFHLQALLELHRVARREVRVFPLLDQGGHPQPALVGDLRQALLIRRIPVQIRRVPYEFQRGGNEMLVMSTW
jgi:hypothetical protein